MQPFLMEKPVAHSTASKFSAVLIGVLTLVEYITLWCGPLFVCHIQHYYEICVPRVTNNKMTLNRNANATTKTYLSSLHCIKKMNKFGPMLSASELKAPWPTAVSWTPLGAPPQTHVIDLYSPYELLYCQISLRLCLSQPTKTWSCPHS